jgi:hypothetical protein
MTSIKYRLTRHARQRMAQRNLSRKDVGVVIRFGRKIYRTGAAFFFLGRRDLPNGRERELERLVGTTIIATEGQILTVYRNARAIAEIKRKVKWELPKRSWA